MVRKFVFWALLGVTGSGVLAGEETGDLGDGTVESAWGGASFEWTREYLYGDKPSLKLLFPVRQSGIWFVPKKADWTADGELSFTLYNPWNDPVEPEILIRSGPEGQVQRLPENATIPSGMLPVPREARVTFRLDLTDPKVREVVDLKQVTGILIGQSTPETTLFLDGFQLKTQIQLAREQKEHLAREAGRAERRLGAQEASLHYKGEVEKALKELGALVQAESVPTEADWRPVVMQANELAAVLEGMPGAGVPDRAIQLHPVSSMTKVFRDDPLPVEEDLFPLEAAGNERVSFQLVVVPGRELRRVEVEASDLIQRGDGGATIPAAQVTVNPVGYVEVLSSFYYLSSRVGWWPDPLLPNRPVDVVNRVQPFWITIHVPSDQKAGEYEGTIRVRAEGVAEEAFAFTVKVWNFSLPVRGEMKTLFSFTYKPENETIRRACYQTLLDNRISPVNIYINGTVQFGDQPERTDLRFCLDRGLNTIVLWNPYNVAGEFPYEYDAKYLEKMNAFIRGYEPLLKSEGAWEMAMVLGFDEITHQDKAFSERASRGAGEFLDALRKEFPDLPLANIGGPPLSPQLIGPGNINIPIPSIASPKWEAQFKALQESGEPYYFYWVYGDPSFMLDLPGKAPRVLSWIAFKYGATGISYYSMIRDAAFPSAPLEIDWPRSQFLIEGTSRLGRNADGIMVYPNRDGTILSSIRLANTRDGIQDYEYLALLKRTLAGREDDAAVQLLAIPDELVTYDSYTKDSQALMSRRRQVAQAIERLREEK